jgi:hypothetical protein
MSVIRIMKAADNTVYARPHSCPGERQAPGEQNTCRNTLPASVLFICMQFLSIHPSAVLLRISITITMKWTVPWRLFQYYAALTSSWIELGTWDHKLHQLTACCMSMDRNRRSISYFFSLPRSGKEHDLHLEGTRFEYRIGNKQVKVRLSFWLIKHHVIKTYGLVEV